MWHDSQISLGSYTQKSDSQKVDRKKSYRLASLQIQIDVILWRH